ncbi:oligosaccharide repeat unit polymerase [Pseudoalteromonas sp. MEBiC 03607]|uniref:O-antigen polymerase n=1 Tax=Pseudoalteromonas sp. MEBiC 03607 TaxID=2563601 RepID=UPI0010941297|nr:O-antigen polymerase [Pseudoalteromonas sp. MEBiC 03607]TGV19325.1 oligosaccharide repeat unit polymerase [Pseudoalteromonas sp. MEBiC 03607]
MPLFFVLIIINLLSLLYLNAVDPGFLILGTEIPLVFIIDTTLTAVMFFFIYRTLDKSYFESYFSYFCSEFKGKYIAIFSWVYLVYYVFNVGHLYYIEGNRELIIESYNPTYLTLLMSKVVLFIICYKVFESSKKQYMTIIPLVLVLILHVFLLQSRTELLQLIYLAITFVVMFGLKVSKFKLMISIFFLFCIGTYISVIQGRVAASDSFLFTFNTFFRYKVSAFQLAEYSISLDYSADNILTPFFGFLSEKIISPVFGVNVPIVTSGSNFLSDFKPVPLSGVANVLYPHWSWFYGAFGLLGLFIKVFYYAILLKLALKFRLINTFLSLVVIIIFVQSWRHPFISTSDFYSLVGIILLDCYLIKRIRIYSENNRLA